MGESSKSPVEAATIKPAKKPPRQLDFETFDQAIADVRQLELGYDKHGRWSLAENCDHLTRFMRYSLHGFPKRYLPEPLAWVARKLLLTDKALHKPFPTGLRAPSFLHPEPQRSQDPKVVLAADHAAVARFIEMLKRVKHHGGEFYPSPIFGRLRPAQWRLVHLKHAAHHLGFLVPIDRTKVPAGPNGAGSRPGAPGPGA